MPDLVYGFDEHVANWVAERVPQVQRGFGPCKAIGVSKDGVLIAGFVYLHWSPEAGTIEMGLAADSPKWATRRVIHFLLTYPFVDCDCQRITLVTSAQNDRANRLAEGLGFKREAVLERAFGPSEDAVIMRLFREEWLAGKYHLGDVPHADQRTSPDAA